MEIHQFPNQKNMVRAIKNHATYLFCGNRFTTVYPYIAHMCVYIYIYMYVCMYACMDVCMHGWMDGCIYKYIYICTIYICKQLEKTCWNYFIPNPPYSLLAWICATNNRSPWRIIYYMYIGSNVQIPINKKIFTD